MKQLETERLILRSININDAIDMFEYASRPDVGPNCGWPVHKNIDSTKKLIKMMADNDQDYAIIYKENGKMIGTFGLIKDRKIDIISDSQIEIGYALNPNYQHKGLISEAISEIKRHIFEDLGLDTIVVAHFDFNIQSRNTIQRNGFRYVFSSQTEWPLIKKTYDTLYYVYTKDMYNESKFNMKYFDVINTRFSVRNFKNIEVEDNKIKILLSMINISPSAVNYNSTRIIIVNDTQLKEKLKEATKFTFDAPIIFVVCHDKNVSWHRRRDNKDHGIIDSSIIATNIMNSVFALGLGTTYVSAFNDQLLREILNIPDNFEINCMLPIGYPSDDAKRTQTHTQDLTNNNVFYNGLKDERN